MYSITGETSISPALSASCWQRMNLHLCRHKWSVNGCSRHIGISVITRLQLVKSIHVLVELVITTCELGVF